MYNTWVLEKNRARPKPLRNKTFSKALEGRMGAFGRALKRFSLDIMLIFQAEIPSGIQNKKGFLLLSLSPGATTIVHMTRIPSKPLNFMRESHAWGFKDAEKTCFWKCENWSQNPPTPCMWWKYLNQVDNSLWCLTTFEEMFQQYSNAQIVRASCRHNISLHASKV